jgi:superfamily II DNA/RNA helicase
MNSFAALGVDSAFTDTLAGRRIVSPTAVQCLVIPPLLEEKSVMFRSATGTGKTFAYLIPALQRILGDPGDPKQGPALLVCAPTFELCSQIKQEIDFLLDGTGCRASAEPGRPSGKFGVSLLIGSGDLSRQIDSLVKTRPIAAVGNPGRLLLLAKMGKLKCAGLRFLVLDEADRLTEKECREETSALAQIITGKTGNREFALTVAACSATVSAKTRESLLPLLENAQLLETDEHEILRDRIQHWAIFSESRTKTNTLISFIAAAKPKKMLVFTGRSYDAGKITAILQNHKIPAAGLYSGMGKKERKEAIDRFRSGKAARNNVTVLVSSDLAARGLDIPGISHVAALDVSDNKDVYIHRAGRTGRAGNHGIMVSIGDEIEMRRLASLEKKLGIIVHPKELYRGKMYKPDELVTSG